MSGINPTLKIPRLFLAGICISSLAFSPFILDFTLIPRFACLSVSLFLCLYLLYSQREKNTISADIIIVSYAAYVLFSGLSLFWAQNKAESLFEIQKLILSLFTFLVTFYSLKKQSGYFTEWLLRLSVVIFIILFLTGCYQLIKLPVLTTDTLYDITGLNGHKNLYASFLFLNLFFLLLATLHLKGAWRVVAAVSILLNVLALLFLKTKAVWLGAGVAGFLYAVFYLYQKKGSALKINFYAALLILIVATNSFFIFILPPLIKSALHASATDTTTPAKKTLLSVEQERLVLWDKTYTIFNKHPIAGTGVGNWQVNFPDATLTGLYRAEDLNYTFQRPHNDFLWILSETGIIGLNLFLVFLIAVLLLLVKTIKAISDNNVASHTVLLCIAFIGGYFTLAFFDFPKERIEHLIWINVLLGIAYYHIKQHVSVPALKSVALPASVYRIALAGLIFIFITGLLRYKGEYYTRKLYGYKNSNAPAGIVTAGKAAWSMFYTLDPTSVPINWYIANACAGMGNYTDAHTYFLKAHSENPYNRNVLNDLGSSYVFNHDVALAKKKYNEAARISPRFDDPKLNLAALYIKEKDFKMASACLDSVFHDSKRRDNYRAIINLNKQK